MPLDCLKVDMSSLAASEDEAYRAWLLEAILIVGRDLALTVTVKGTDTDEQLGSLRAMGCTMAAGASLGLPAPLSAVQSFFEGSLPAAPTTSPSPYL